MQSGRPSDPADFLTSMFGSKPSTVDSETGRKQSSQAIGGWGRLPRLHKLRWPISISTVTTEVKKVLRPRPPMKPASNWRTKSHTFAGSSIVVSRSLRLMIRTSHTISLDGHRGRDFVPNQLEGHPGATASDDGRPADGPHITKNAPYSWGNFNACAITRFQKPQQLSWAGRGYCSVLVDQHVRSCAASRDPISAASAVANCG